MSYRLIGRDFVPDDVVAKVTGRARYAEDFRATGMLVGRLLLSPVPHGLVRSIDASEALALPGVIATLTADEVPALDATDVPILTNEPRYLGQPILAVAAVDDAAAAAAVERIHLQIDARAWVHDPRDSLRPGGTDARSDGNTGGMRLPLQQIRWSDAELEALAGGTMPEGRSAEEWTYGELEAGFAASAHVIDETFVTASAAHHSMEPRSALAYWQGGRCYVHGSTQSHTFIVPKLASYIGIEPSKLVLIAENCGGGFGSKGAPYPLMAVPAHLARKTARPVMLRVSRREEYFVGSARSGFQGRIRLGFRQDGRLLAADLCIIQQNGPYNSFFDFRGAGEAVSLMYQPIAMRWRALPVYTNTPARWAQRGPGHTQMAGIVEPLFDKAARALGIDRVEIRRHNAPASRATFGAEQEATTTSFARETLDLAATRYRWAERRAESGRRRGSRVIGIGIGQSPHVAGFNGFDGLVRITPDGILHIHTGVGNLGTYSHAATARIAAEVLGFPWERCVVERGDSRRALPWNRGQVASNTSFTVSRANHAAALDAVSKLKAIAASALGGSASDYDVRDERVVRRTDPTRFLTAAAAAERAIALGGAHSGESVPDDLHPITQAAVAMVKGSGLVGVAKDRLPVRGSPHSFAVAFVTIELDLETGQHEVLDYECVADCGTVLHPMGLAAQIRGGAVWGFGAARLERHVYDPVLGLPANVGLYQCKPASALDVPSETRWAALDRPDEENPVGARGIGEPVMSCAFGALLSAISDALGGHVFNRTPVVPDMVLNFLAGQPQSCGPLDVNGQ